MNMACTADWIWNFPTGPCVEDLSFLTIVLLEERGRLNDGACRRMLGHWEPLKGIVGPLPHFVSLPPFLAATCSCSDILPYPTQKLQSGLMDRDLLNCELLSSSKLFPTGDWS